jgi:serine/threonine-protein kinase HipA
MADILDVWLAQTRIGQLTLLTGDRTFFVFEEEYLNDPNRPVLSQSFITGSGEIIPETRTYKTKLPPFFSNLLPEGHLRTYLAKRGGVKPSREFKLLELFGEDLPGAVSIKSANQRSTPPELQAKVTKHSPQEQPYRFSLAGVQLKFSALAESKGGLTIPASGVGGDWIVKLPTQNFSQVPENEWAMLHLAKEVGISVPETDLVPLEKIAGLPELGFLSGNLALAVKRFDRKEQQRIHIEDFAQVYNVFPNDKYNKVSYDNITNMIWILTGETGLQEFIRRLTFTVLIGNGDMHLKNWSFIYTDGVTPELSPAYDFVSTVPYLPGDHLALNLAGEKDMGMIGLKHFQKLTRKAEVPEYLVIDTIRETIESTFEKWKKQKMSYDLPSALRKRIDVHLEGVVLNFD